MINKRKILKNKDNAASKSFSGNTFSLFQQCVTISFCIIREVMSLTTLNESFLALVWILSRFFKRDHIEPYLV